MADSVVLLIIFYLVMLLVPILLGIPVIYSIGITSILLLVLPVGPVFPLNEAMDLLLIRMFRGSQRFILVSLPLYLYAGRLLINGGAVSRLFEFAEAVVGPIQGGIAQVNIVASILFSGMSGSALADAAGLGLVEFDMMEQAGYDKDLAIAVTGSSAIIGPIFPPSIPLIIYGSFAGVSIGSLFLAGIVPGLLMALLLFITVYVLTSNREFESNASWGIGEIWSTFITAIPGIFTIFLIIGGLLTGWFTATEAGGAAAVWAMVLGFFIYGDLNSQKFYEASLDTLVDTCSLLIILSTALAYAFVVVATGIPTILSETLLRLNLSPTAVILLIVIVLLLLGMVLGPLTVLILFLPVLEPNFVALGIDPLHFGIVMILTLMIGMLTPPVGAILFVLEQISGVSITKISKALVPFYIPLLLALLFIILFPDLVTFVPTNFADI